VAKGKCSILHVENHMCVIFKVLFHVFLVGPKNLLLSDSHMVIVVAKELCRRLSLKDEKRLLISCICKATVPSLSSLIFIKYNNHPKKAGFLICVDGFYA